MPTSGTYWLYLQALGTDAALFVDGKRVGVTGTFQGDVHGDILQANQDNIVPTTDGLDNVRHAVDMSAGARRLQDYPATDPRHPERSAAGVDHRTTYSEGVHVGYRWFDHEHLEPLFAFGHGLTYTRFAYSALEVARSPDGGLEVSVRIENTGPVDGDEVPQVYLGAPEEAPEGVQFSPRSLAAFDTVTIAAGQTRTVSLHVPPRRLQYRGR